MRDVVIISGYYTGFYLIGADLVRLFGYITAHCS